MRHVNVAATKRVKEFKKKQTVTQIIQNLKR